jgi:hypothetical protein
MDSLPTYALPDQHIIARSSRTGTDIQHAFAKELIAGFASAEVDKLFETKGEYLRNLLPSLSSTPPYPSLLLVPFRRVCADYRPRHVRPRGGKEAR